MHGYREDLMGVQLITYYTAYAAGPGLRRSRALTDRFPGNTILWSDSVHVQYKTYTHGLDCDRHQTMTEGTTFHRENLMHADWGEKYRVQK
jgi:hypothetical protein